MVIFCSYNDFSKKTNNIKEYKTKKYTYNNKIGNFCNRFLDPTYSSIKCKFCLHEVNIEHSMSESYDKSVTLINCNKCGDWDIYSFPFFNTHECSGPFDWMPIPIFLETTQFTILK